MSKVEASSACDADGDEDALISASPCGANARSTSEHRKLLGQGLETNFSILHPANIGLLLHSVALTFVTTSLNTMLYGVLLGYLNARADVYATAQVLIGSPTNTVKLIKRKNVVPAHFVVLSLRAAQEARSNISAMMFFSSATDMEMLA